MKKNYSKRLLSIFLSAVIVLSSLTVGFYAIAATPDETTSPVSEVEESIQSYYDNHRNNLYSSNEELKKAAREAFDKTSSEIKALSNEEKLQLNPSAYAYWLTVVQDDVAREKLSLSKTPTSAQRYTVLSQYLSDMEAVIGAFPSEQKAAIDAFAPFAVDIDGLVLASTKLVYKDNELAQATLDSLLENISGLTADGIRFSDYLLPISSGDGGFYFNQTKPDTDKTGNTIKNVVQYVFLEQQSLNDCATPRFNYTEQVVRTGERPNYEYSWAEGKSAETYFQALDEYEKQYITNVVEPSNSALDIVINYLDKVADFDGLKSSVTSVCEASLEYLNKGEVDFNIVSDAVQKTDSLTQDAKYAFDALGASSIAIYAKTTTTVLGVEYTVDNITPEIVYTKLGYYVTEIYSVSKMLDICYTLVVDEFNEFIAGIDLDKITEEDIEMAISRYLALPNGYQSSISNETLTKYMKIIKPVADPYDYAKEVEDFKPTKIVRPQNSEVAMTVGGIQSAVDGLWNLVANTLLPLLAPEIDLSDGLDKVLEENVYTVDMIEKIFDLYATLSHDKTYIEDVGMDLGTIIGLLITPYGISNLLTEEKFQSAVEKIAPCQNNPSGKLDALAAVEFEASDFGFENGDYEGFLDALLAVLRPITTLLAPNAKAAGIISVGINMFDYVGEDGKYVNGVYSCLVPLLEQLGCTSLPTAEEYKANYESVKEASGENVAADEFLRPVINALFNDVVSLVSSDPLNGLIKVLPRIAYIVDQDMINPTLKSVFSNMGILGGLAGSLDLSKEAIDGMITGRVIDLTSVAGTDCKITLKQIDWAALANCCTVESHKSVSNSNEYFILRTGETDTCFTTVFYYIYDVLFADAANYKSLTTLLSGVVGSLGAIGDIVMGYVVGWHDAGSVEAYGSILDMLGKPGDTPIEPDDPENPDPEKPDPENPDPENPDSNTPDEGGNNSNNGNNKANLNSPEKTKNPLIPNTGAEDVAGFCLGAIIIGAAVALVVMCVLRKKKTN